MQHRLAFLAKRSSGGSALPVASGSRTRKRGLAVLATATLTIIVLVLSPVAVFASPSVLFWTSLPAPVVPFLYGYTGEWNGDVFCVGGTTDAVGRTLSPSGYM